MAHLSQTGKEELFPFPLMPTGIRSACRVTQVRRARRRAVVKPPAQSWVRPEVSPGYAGLC